LVRTEAARAVARIPDGELRSSERQKREAAIEEYITGLRLNNDRAGAHLMLGNLFEELGRGDDAIAAYRTAMRTEQRATGPRTNLAALLERQAERAEAQANQLAQSGVSASAERYFAKARADRERAAALRREELPLLARDAELAPDSAAIQYRYGLALYLDGQLEAAESALSRAAELDPQVPDFHLAVALLYQKLQRYDEAVQAARRLFELRPDNPSYRQLLLELQQAAVPPESRSAP
jgi:tetratricopeptide (TPR) repeat protein